MAKHSFILTALAATAAFAAPCRPATPTTAIAIPSTFPVSSPVASPVASAVSSPSAIPAPDKPAAGSTGGSTSLGSAVDGSATFYGGNINGGTCSFTGYTLPAGLFGTAFSGSAWNSAAHCGECVEVTGPNGNTLTAMIVDQCPECDAPHLDLFQDAFATLADLSKGIIPISYKPVSCPVTGPLTLRNKSGTSRYWFSMQVLNASVPVSTLEVSVDGGATWQATERRDYNFFEKSSGFGADVVSVRVTAVDGSVVVKDGVSVADSSETVMGSNF